MKNKQYKPYELSMDCTVEFGITVNARSLAEAEVLADRIQEQLQQQLTVDCGRLDYVVYDDVHMNVLSVQQRAIYYE